jgi:hypothetical protein
MDRVTSIHPFPYPLISSRSVLNVVFVSAQLTTGLVLLAIKARTFPLRYLSIGFRSTFRFANVSLILSRFRGLRARKLTTGYTLLYTLVLILLSFVDARCRLRLGIRGNQSGDQDKR